MKPLALSKASLVTLVLTLLLQLAPGATTALAESPAQAPLALPASHYISGVPLYSQQHNLSCEYASAHMLTAYWGAPINESRFINAIPQRANPHLGFRGNIDGSGGWINDYGIYAEPIASFLQSRGFSTRVFYDGLSSLKSEIAQDHPVIVWLTISLNYATPVSVLANGSYTKLVPYEHTVVVTGYDESGVYVNGPAQAIRAHFGWADFLRSWGYFDNMALSITSF